MVSEWLWNSTERVTGGILRSIIAPAMPLVPGRKFGPYEIVGPLGAGGMGEVYRAKDTRLDRVVAIKVLSAHLAEMPDLRGRFEREARTIASLNHPHICTLYDVGQQDGMDYLVLEYLEGETLAQRLLKGPLPLDQVLQCAIEIADALDKAHRKGVTHRDLKPRNIMLTESGSKLLDFGLAKLRQEAEPATPLSELTAEDDSITAQGTIIGTLRYMAPEQIEAGQVDARTDIFAFGLVVYEMTTGKRAFDGKSQASLIAKILETDPPPISSLQPMTPPGLNRLVKKCLAKEPERRWQAASDVCDELKWIVESGTQAADSAGPSRLARKNWRKTLVWVAGGLAGCAIAGLAVWNLKPAPVLVVSRTVITLPADQQLAALDLPALAVSPDGRNIVYVAVQTGTRKLFLRPLSSQEAKPIVGTEGAVAPFFSPDSQQVGFFVDGKLKKVSVNGGVAMTLASAPSPRGASWSSDGTIALQSAAGRSLGLQQVSQEGGVAQPLTHLGVRDPNHGWPEILPGNKAVLFAYSSTFGAWNKAQIAVKELGASEPRYLAQTGTQPRYAATGHLLFVQHGTLMAAPFNARRLALTGTAIPAVEDVMESATTGAAQYSISATGTLVYLAGGVVASQSRLVWVSRKGEEQVLTVGPHDYEFPRISPDGRRVAVTIAEEEQQIWVHDISKDTLTRLTFEGNSNSNPTWYPNGTRIAFGSNQSHPGPNNLFWLPADGSGRAERLSTSDYTHSPNSFSPDGQLLAFVETNPNTGRDVWVLKLTDRKAQAFVQTPAEETAPAFSPDGRWLAYSSNESGRREIYVQAYPGPGGKWQISTDGGQEPVWNPRGGQLFYRSESKIMEVDVEKKSEFSAGKPRMLFEGPYLPTGASFPYYDVSPDGQRFLMLKPVDLQTPVPTQINVILNWFEELKQKVPAEVK